MNDTESRAREIFLESLDQPPDQVLALVEQACGGDDQVRQRVHALVQAHNRSGDFLAASRQEEVFAQSSAAVEQTAMHTTASMRAGETIGPYKLLEEIGEGGMGSVWIAQQSEPIKRKVAIKLIKAGMDSKSVLARFGAERQALAMMDHANIARVLDGGMTEQGRPYFAMEYVKGVPLTEYCDQAKLSVKERLELFLPICNAVQHAHQKGIIHRDLKPSNILVCLYDGKPVPKVIDFGLAKAMHHSLTDQSLYTAHGMMLGTPLYMSPEQAEHNNLDIDTRTDVYSLGVILYELLTGSTPLEKQQLKEAAFNEIMRLIKEVEPPKPSTRLSGSASLPGVAAQRSIDPRHLTRSMTGDLDWVVMKALEKERGRRYETANGLAADILRHLSGEAVVAAPPSSVYRLKKFIRRNRVMVTASGAVAAALLIGMIGFAWQAQVARDQRDIAVLAQKSETEQRKQADAARAEAQTQQAKAKEQEAEARKQAEIAEEVKKFLETELIAQANVFAAVISGDKPDPDLKLVTAIDRAATKISERFNDQPLLEASVRHAIASSYVGRGLYYDAQLHLERVCELYRAELDKDKSEETQSIEAEMYIDTLMELSAIYVEQGQLKKAVLPLQTAEDNARRLVEVDPDAKMYVDMLVAMRVGLETNNSSKAMVQMSENFIKHLDSLATAPEATDRDPVLDPVLDRLTDYLESHAEQIEMLAEAMNHMFDGKYLEAELALKQLSAKFQPTGAFNILTLDSVLGEVYFLQGKYPESLKAFEDSHAELTKWLGAEHPMVGASRMGLGQVHIAEKRFAQAESELRVALTIFELRTPDHYQHFYVRNLLGAALAGQQKFTDAESLLKSGYKGMKDRSENIPKHELMRLAGAAARLVAFYDAGAKPVEAAKWRTELEAIKAAATKKKP